MPPDVLATGERAFVTGYSLPGMDVRVLLETGRFAVYRSGEIDLAAPRSGDLAD